MECTDLWPYATAARSLGLHFHLWTLGNVELLTLRTELKTSHTLFFTGSPHHETTSRNVQRRDSGLFWMSESQALRLDLPPALLIRCIKNSVIMEQHLAPIKPSPHTRHGPLRALVAAAAVGLSASLSASAIPSFSFILSAHFGLQASLPRPEPDTHHLFYPPSLLGSSRLLLWVRCCTMMHFSRCIWGLTLVLFLGSEWTRAQQTNNTRWACSLFQSHKWFHWLMKSAWAVFRFNRKKNWAIEHSFSQRLQFSDFLYCCCFWLMTLSLQ